MHHKGSQPFSHQKKKHTYQLLLTFFTKIIRTALEINCRHSFYLAFDESFFSIYFFFVKVHSKNFRNIHSRTVQISRYEVMNEHDGSTFINYNNECDSTIFVVRERDRIKSKRFYRRLQKIRTHRTSLQVLFTTTTTCSSGR